MFNEQDWDKLIFLLNDTQNWIDEMCRDAIYRLPVMEKRKFRRKNYYLTVSAIAHILEKHYQNIPLYSHAVKFTISVVEIVGYIRDAYAIPTSPVPGCTNQQRVMDAGRVIGNDRTGKAVSIFTVVTDLGGKILTAFPGVPGESDIATINKGKLIKGEHDDESNHS